MEKILKTDNAYQAIDKINANFEESGGGGQNEQSSISDSFVGQGTTSIYYNFPAKPGDYLHVYFPNGSWATSSREGYARMWFGWMDNNNTRHGLGNLSQEQWTVPNYGFDLYVPEGISNMKNAYLGFRATSGVTVPFTITWLSKSEMKDYFADEMADTVAKVRARQGNETATLAICTDIHYRDIDESYRPFAPFAAPGMMLAMKEFSRRVRLDNIVCLGDGIDGRQSVAQGKQDARVLAGLFSQVGVPLIYAIGNHDDNRYYAKDNGDRNFTASEIHAEFIQQVDERTSVGGAMQGCNYYRDIERLKLRFIVLMSINFNKQYYFTTETQNFLTATFASMPEGYKAVIFTHTPMLDSHNYSTAQTINGGSATSSIIESNIDKVIGVFDGHTHFDDQWMTPFVEINEGCAKVYNTQTGELSDAAPEGAYFCERAAGDYREQLWDAVVIDKANSLLSCIRFGAGVDRYVHLTPIEVSAGNTTTLTPSVLTASTWETRESEASSISIASGVVSVDSGATSGARLTAICKDASGNMEFWIIKVA